MTSNARTSDFLPSQGTRQVEAVGNLAAVFGPAHLAATARWNSRASGGEPGAFYQAVFRASVSGNRVQISMATTNKGAPNAMVSGRPMTSDKAAVSGGAAKLKILP